MKLTLNTRTKKILATLLLFIVLIIPISQSYNSWLAYSQASNPPLPQGLANAIQIEPDNPDYYLLLGFYLEEYDVTAPREKIASSYAQALSLSPFNYKYWFSLADFLYKEGDRENAIFALNHSTKLAPGVVSLRWAGGMLASRMNYTDAVIDNLSYVIKTDNVRRFKAFSLLWQSIGNAEQILDILPKDKLKVYFYFLFNTNRFEESGVVLEELRKHNYDTKDIAFYYISRFITSNQLESAIDEWTKTYGKLEGVWNGSFEEDFINGGFGWEIENVKGAVTKRVKDGHSGDYALKIEFNGTENVNFNHIRQYIPVEVDTEYTFQSYVKSENITTKNGPLWQVTCGRGNGLNVKTKPILGTNAWQLVTLIFKTPANCDLLSLRLRREKSNKIDKYISGTVWVDNAKLTKDSSSNETQYPNAYTN